MRYSPIMVLTLLLAGCATSEKYDARLNGAWRSNQEETVAAAFQRDPRWTNAPPEKVQKFRDIFGHMIVSYHMNEVRCKDREKEWSLRYRIVDRGENYVVIRTQGGGIADQNNIRIRFVDHGAGYWTDSGKLLGTDTPEEKFDKVAGPDGAAEGSLPVVY
jgi:hypothetical protein